MSDVIGEIEEVSRRGAEEVTFDWRIPNFPSMLHGRNVWYRSSEFRFGEECWRLSLYPHWQREVRNPASGWVRLDLDRIDRGPPATFLFSAGIRGFGGVEKGGEGEKEFSNEDWFYHWYHFCTRSDLLEHGTRLMPDDTLTVTCVLKKPAAARGELPPDVLVTYTYKELESATQNFGDLPLRAGGCKIGEGGFGTVYRAIVRGNVVAVKRLKDPLDTQFITELKTFTNYKHENLVPLLGFSIGPNCCLVYEYMSNGSLEDRLACKDRSEPLSWQTRLSISYGTALGINHLHTFGEQPEVHRDIKSANILLDQNFVAKVADFGLVRTGSSGDLTTMPVTNTCIGTRGYMPRESLVGDVSIKWDTFSFGVVLLELLTGLPPYDPNRKDRYLITHMEKCKDILRRLDSRAKWDKKAATELYRITQRCLAESKRSRPTISEVSNF